MNNQELRKLEEHGDYVFHGSGNVIDVFEPKQAYTVINGAEVPDGKPAVFASPYVDYAIFMAVINEINCPEGFRAGCAWEEGELKFTATKETLNQLNQDSKGYVYIFHKSDFVEIRSSEWVSYREMTPIKMIEVQWSDFDRDIEEIESDTKNN